MCIGARLSYLVFFFFNDTATTEIYTLSLHDALPISHGAERLNSFRQAIATLAGHDPDRSEEHTSELQSQSNLVCRLLLEKKKKTHSLVVPTHTRDLNTLVICIRLHLF